MTRDPTAVADAIRTPALLLDLDKLESNLSAMAAKCRRLGVALRPHVKTHKCVEIARRQRAHGAIGLTVSTLAEAEVFASHGFDDITWAFPLILGRLDQVLELAKRTRLGVVVDSAAAVDALEAADSIAHLGTTLPVWLKVDCGYHRAGVNPGSDEALRLAARIASAARLEFLGLLTHSGHAYQPGSDARLLAIAEQERDVMVGFARRLRQAGITAPGISVGSTPAMARIEDLSGVTEARPGNYALYDLTQVSLGSCAVADCAATVLTSVVSAGPRHSVIDAGALALSKDLGPSTLAAPSYGAIFSDYEAGRLDEDLRVTSVSQEHGIVNRRLAVGERLRVLPNHSCLTVAQFDEFVVLRQGRIAGRWKISRVRD